MHSLKPIALPTIPQAVPMYFFFYTTYMMQEHKQAYSYANAKLIDIQKYTISI